MANDRSKYGDKLGRDRYGQGQGAQVPRLPEFQTVPFKNFAGGYFAADAPQDLAENMSPDMTDMLTTIRDSLMKAPGTRQDELLLPRTPSQLALHVGAAMRSELAMFDPPYVGFKKPTEATRWIPMPNAQPQDVSPWFWAAYSNIFLFGSGLGRNYSHEWGTDVVTEEEAIPPGKSFAVFAARLFVAAPVVGGVRAAMGIMWSGVDGYNKFDLVNDAGSGFEELISDTAAGDELVAIRAMGLDLLAILGRNSVWIGRRTGDLDRPADFQPRVMGKGAVNEACAKTVTGGVLYLGMSGVEFFNGNDSVNVSAAINPELLPLDDDRLGEYSATFNPTTQQYHLYTPTATYIFDLVRQRWQKRSMVALGGQPFPSEIVTKSWAQLVGTWADQVDSWAGLGPREKASDEMMFLGVDSNVQHALHYEDKLSFTHFGFAFTPRWTSPSGESPNQIGMVSFNTIRTRYTASALSEVNFFLPNNVGQYEPVNQLPVVLDATVQRRLVQYKSLWTGLEAGLRIEITSGNPEFHEFGLEVLPRGPRIDPGYTFVPRDFEADF